MVREAQGWDLLDALQHGWLPDADSGFTPQGPSGSTWAQNLGEWEQWGRWATERAHSSVNPTQSSER